MKIYLILSFCLFITTQVYSRKLLMIECITRHGVRYPQNTNQYDYSNITLFDNANKELTAEGRQMHYLLGRRLYQKYWKEMFQGSLYENKLNRSLIYAKSTDTNRTIQSLANLLQGFFAQLQPQNEPFSQNSETVPPFEGQIQDLLKDQHFSQWKNSHSVPIHVQKGMQGEPGIANEDNQGDFLAKQQHNICPNQVKWQQEAYQSQFVKDLMKNPNIIKAIKRLQTFFPDIELNFKNVYKYVDNYMCLKAMGRPYLSVFEEPKIKQYLTYLIVARLYVVFLSSETQRKTLSKTLLSTTINNMKRAIDESGPKMIFYSGHDSTLAILLASMNFTNLDCLHQKYLKNITKKNCYWEYPHFASSFVFELWEEEDSTQSIDVSINGKKYDIPVCGYQKSCSLETFQAWFEENSLKVSPNQACGVYQSSTSSSFLLQFLCGTFLISLLLWGIWRSRGERRRPSGQILSEQDLDRL